MWFASSVCGQSFVSDCYEDSLEIVSKGKVSKIQIEIAADPISRATGLMFREHLEPTAGMLFIYEKPAPVMFWMKNTLIPLDIIFIDSFGKVIKIERNATPLSEALLKGGKDTQYVLELLAGQADLLGIDIGTHIRHASITSGGHSQCQPLAD